MPPGIEKLQDFQEEAERQERQSFRGPEGLKEAVGLSLQILREGKETQNIQV